MEAKEQARNALPSYDYPQRTLSAGGSPTLDELSDRFEEQRAVLGPLVRVIEEAAAGSPWALIGASSLTLRGIEARSPNLEFMVNADALGSLAKMLDVSSRWGRGAYVAAERLHFMRHGIPVFVFARPTFHGRYESLSPFDIPALWDARETTEVGGVGVPVLPLEWELILAVVLEQRTRLELLQAHFAEHGFDNRLLTRLLREGRVEKDIEESVWAVVEGRA